MAEREIRRQKAEKIRVERRSKREQSRGRQRWQKGLVAVGTAFVIAVGGGYGIYQFVQQQEQVEVVPDENQDLVFIQQEIKRLGIEKSEQEIGLWRKLEQEIEDAKLANELTAGHKLNLMNQTLALSKNPHISDAVNFMAIEYGSGNVATGIDPNPIDRQQDYSPMNTGYDISPNNEFKMTLVIRAAAILERELLDITAGQTHEVEHLRNIKRTDAPRLSAQQRYNIQVQRSASRVEMIAEEARGYIKHAQAIIYQLGLTVDPSQYISEIRSKFKEPNFILRMIVNAIKAKNNPDDPAWKKFIEREGLAN